MAYSRLYVQVKANKESIHRRHIIVRKCPRKQKKEVGHLSVGSTGVLSSGRQGQGQCASSGGDDEDGTTITLIPLVLAQMI